MIEPYVTTNACASFKKRVNSEFVSEDDYHGLVLWMYLVPQTYLDNIQEVVDGYSPV